MKSIREDARPLQMNSGRIGDLAEYKAVVWLIEQEYEVFKNVCCNGPYDLVAIKGAITHRIDVKKPQIYKAKGGTLVPGVQPSRIHTDDVVLLYVYGEHITFCLEEMKDLLNKPCCG